MVVDPLARLAELEAENASLKERVREIETQPALVLGKVTELERLVGRNSSNSAKPPSSDNGTAKTDGHPLGSWRQSL